MSVPGAGSLDLGTLHLKLKADNAELKADLAEAKHDAKQAGDESGRSWWQTLLGWLRKIGQLFRSSGREAMDGFWRDANGRLHDQRGRFVAETKAMGEALGEAAGGGTRLAASLGELGGKAGGMLGTFGMLLLVVSLVSAAIVFMIPLVYALGGALAAIPAITTGGIAALATLLIGLTGITEAFKKQSAAGATAADRARTIAMAERRLADAHEEELEAQLALTRAREQAAEQLEDLDRSLRGSKLDQLDAVDALKVAEKDLERAQRSKNSRLIDEATRAYERAKLRVEEVNDRVDDLTLQQERAAAAGVEGSDAVKTALKRQEHATREVEDATYDLGKAHKSAGAAAAQEATKLAASALATVAAIKGLKAGWEDLRLGIQERLFSGLDKEIPELFAAWQPTLKERLGGMASMFNGLFKTWAATSKKPEFIANIAAGWASIEGLIDRVGKAVAGPGLEAFGKLSRAAKPFIDMLGDKLGGMIDHFAAWIDSAERSGALQQFFDKASRFFSDLWDIGGDVVGIIGELFSIWSDSESGDQAVDTFTAIKDALHDLREWLKDPETRAQIKGWIDGFTALGNVGMQVFGWLINTGIPETQKAIEKVGKAFDKVKDTVGDVKDAIVGAWGSMSDAAKGAFNLVAWYWNRTLGGVSFRVPDWVPGLAGKEYGFPKIPFLAGGGLVKATPGGRPVIMAEAGQDEVASPVPLLRRIVREELDGALGGGVGIYDGGRGIHVDRLEVRAYNDKFSLGQVERELALHGVH